MALNGGGLRDMKRILYTSAFLVLTASVAFLQDRAVGQTPAPAKAAASAADPHRALLNTYCVGCHNSRIKIGGLALDNLNLQTAANDAPTWEKALRKLRGNLMPPPGSPQPPQKDVTAFVSWMENKLDTTAKGPKAGYVPIQRMNRTEYASAVKALLGVEVNEKDVLPQDIQVEGFDNIAEALTTSPAFLDQYITAARRIAKQGVGDMHPPISAWAFKPLGHTDPEIPFPPGIRGAMKVTHTFPADGEYRFNLYDLSIGLYNSSMQNVTTLVILLDGKTVFKKSLGGPEDLALANRKAADGWQQILDRFQKLPFKIQSGKHDIIIGFIDRSHVESDENVAGISNSTSRPLIFVCDPQKIGEEPCAKQIAESLAHRAFRRPVKQDDLDHLMRFYKEGRLDGAPFDKGVEQIVAAVLASPDFLFRSIRGSKAVSKTTEAPLTDLELASRLSFFIWNTGPDAELLKLAETNS